MLVAFILSLIAIANASYLTLLKLTATDNCLIGNSCNDVINSIYGSILGVPLSYIGVIFFTCVSYLLFQYKFKKSVNLNHIFYVLILGSVASLLFLIIQFVIIKSFCLFCTLSAIITFTLTILCFYNLQQVNTTNKTDFKHYIVIGVIVFVCALLHLVPKLFLDYYNI